MTWACKGCGTTNHDHYIWCQGCDHHKRPCEDCGGYHWEWVLNDAGRTTANAECQDCGNIIGP